MAAPVASSPPDASSRPFPTSPVARGWPITRTITPVPRAKKEAKKGRGATGEDAVNLGTSLYAMPRMNRPAQPMSWACPWAWTRAPSLPPAPHPTARAKATVVPRAKPAVKEMAMAVQMGSR